MTINEQLSRGAAALGHRLTRDQLAQLEQYFIELKKWNRRINLVAAATDPRLLETHFLDSLTPLPLLDPCPAPGLVDVGSGAGFPGLVLKIARPELAVTLVEPRQKRAAFLRQIIRLLGLKGIEVLEARLTMDGPDFAAWRHAIPLFTSRALTAIGDFLELCAPFSAPGGRVICLKGRRADEELSQWRQLHPDSPYTLSRTMETSLPFSGTPRQLLVFSRDAA
jgi:16S rRNA (guanine527-N7)-methyltransferase